MTPGFDYNPDMTMTLLAASLVPAMMQGEPTSPYLLEIHQPGRVAAPAGLTDTATGRTVSVDEIAKAARGVRFVLVGEQHNTPAHHAMQAAVIEALVKDGREVTVGFEMFTFDNQKSLAGWTQGRWTEEEFITKANWETQWGFPFAAYRPIFEAVRTHKLPMVALNVPRTWVRQISRNGVDAMLPETKARVPKLDLSHKGHRMVFDSLMGGHAGDSMNNIYAAQVLWDEGMAINARREMDLRRANPKAVMVIVAGIGHVMHHAGINLRITQGTGEPTISVVCVEPEAPREVARSLGHYVYRPAPGG